MKIRYSDEVREQMNARRRVPKGRTPEEMELVLYDGLWVPRWFRAAVEEEKAARAEARVVKMVPIDEEKDQW